MWRETGPATLSSPQMSVAYHRIVPEVPTATWVKGVAMLGRLLSVGVALSSFAWWVNNIDVAATAAGATKEVDRIGDMARTLSDVGMVARGMLLPTGVSEAGAVRGSRIPPSSCGW